MIYKFTLSSERVLQIAKEIATKLGHNYIGTEHILYGLVKEDNGVASQVLKRQNLNSDIILDKIEDLIGSNNNEIVVLGFTPRTKRVIENAYLEAKKSGSDYIGTEHFIIGIMKESDSIAMRIMMNLNIKPENIYKDISKIINEFDNQDSNSSIQNYSKDIGSYNLTQTLNNFSTDLTKEAREGKKDPIIGRNSETNRVIEILSRRTKNNPCLIGEPGVGKTAVVEGLAQKIVSRKYT